MTVPPSMRGIFWKYLNPVNKVSCKFSPIVKEVTICGSLGRLIIQLIPEYFLVFLQFIRDKVSTLLNSWESQVGGNLAKEFATVNFSVANLTYWSQ